MAVQSVITGNFLNRSDSYIDHTMPFTIAAWYLQNASVPTGSTFRTIYNYGDDLGVNSYIFLGSDTATNDVILGAFDGTTYVQTAAQIPTSGVWEYVAAVYDGANALKFYVNGVLIGTLTVTVSGFPFVQKDGFIGGSYMDFGFGYVGVFQAALTPTQLNAQAKLATPATTSLSFTPLTTASMLNDISGNGHNWTLNGVLTTIPDPWDAEVNQIPVEILGNVLDPEAVVTQIPIEILGDIIDPSANVTQIAVEILRTFQCVSAPGDLRCTQLPIEAAYDYAILRPSIKSGGRAWLTPPPTPSI